MNYKEGKWYFVLLAFLAIGLAYFCGHWLSVNETSEVARTSDGVAKRGGSEGKSSDFKSQDVSATENLPRELQDNVQERLRESSGEALTEPGTDNGPHGDVSKNQGDVSKNHGDVSKSDQILLPADGGAEKPFHVRYGLPNMRDVRRVSYGLFLEEQVVGIEIAKEADTKIALEALYKVHDAKLIVLEATAITKEIAEAVAHHQSIEEMWIYRVSALPTEFAKILGLSNVKRLHLRSPEFFGVMSSDSATALLSMKSLVELHVLNEFPVDDGFLNSVGALSSLEILAIHNAGSFERRGSISAKGLLALRSLKRLRILQLRGVSVVDPTRPKSVLAELLASLPQLVSLRISGWRLPAAEFEECVPAMMSLRALSIGASRIGDAAFKKISLLTQLEYLECPIDLSVESLLSLVNLKALKALDISRTEIDDSGLESLAKALPKLEHLAIMDCTSLTHRGIEALAAHRQLESLAMSGFRGNAKEAIRGLVSGLTPKVVCLSDMKGLSSEFIAEELKGTSFQRVHLFYSQWLAEDSKARLEKSLSPIELDFKSPIHEIPFEGN